MDATSAPTSNRVVNTDAKQHIDHWVERSGETTSKGTEATAAVFSMVVPTTRPLMSTTATVTTSEPRDIISAYDIGGTCSNYQKKAGHHFYYVPTYTGPEFDDLFTTELPRTTSSDSNDRQHSSLLLHPNSNFMQQRDQHWLFHAK